MATSNEAAKKDDAIPDNNAPQKEKEEVNRDKEVPKSNGNLNPTASTKVSTNDLFELASSSTVETEVPTVSTPVLTGSLYVPSVTSSVPIIISRGGSSFPEPLSLGNAMSFENGLEDFFGYTSDAVSLNDVAADLRNMETAIQVSPTPNLRIHKDHPKIYQMDVKSAFLYRTIDEEEYMMQPPGFQDHEFPYRVYKVEKAMYRLHQAPRAWYGTLSKYLLDNGFQRGELNLFLGLHVLQKKDGIFLSQDKYGKDGTGKDMELHLYRSMIGSLMYLIASRPDIMFAICACARHQVTPKECHLYAVKRIFRYLKGHPKLELWYPKESSFDLVAYSDSDYGGANQDINPPLKGGDSGNSANGLNRDPVVNMCLNFLHGSDSEQMTHEFMHIYLVSLNETAFPTGDVRYEEAFPTVTRLDVGQDKENIAKTSSMPNEASPRVTSLGGSEGTGDTVKDSDKSADKGSDSTYEMANVLGTLGAANILASGGLSGSFPLAVIFTTARIATQTTRVTRSSRGVVIESSSSISANILSISKKDKGKGKMTEPEQPSKEKVLEQMSVQLARDLEAKFAQEDQIIREQAERDSEIARIYAKRELEMMIAELDRSNEMVAKHLAQIKKYQAQQKKPATKIERRNFYMSILRSNAGWKAKDFKGMTFEQIEEKFIPVWEKMQDFMPMNSKL
nr:hypothetical protein [Tanacetum cinerariifolium]